MPLSELNRSINEMNEHPQQKSSGISYIPNDEFVELIWEKGQIMIQGQSNKAKKTPISSNFQFQIPKVQGKDDLLDVSVPEMGLNQDDDMVPWLNYSLDEFSSDLLPELSSLTVHEPPVHSGLDVIEKIDKKGPNSLVGLGQSNASKVSSSSHLSSFVDPAVRSRASDIGNSNCGSKAHNVNHRDLVGNLENMVQKQDSVLPCSTSSVLNFSHFSRPAVMAMATAKTTVQNHEPQTEIGQPGLDSVKKCINPLASKPLDEPHCVDKSSNDAHEDNGGSEHVKSNEPVGGASSVCSGNIAERASNDVTKNCKRKFRDMKDFDCQNQDAEEESLGTKTVDASRVGTGSKRSRAADVHSLSERRRRDKINEKMRALQELIPNCNKVDKASVLDEAIEYLKTLQLQVQIMSMGTGLCMPPMMFPTGMPHMHPHFSPMGIGMGMGYGMGMEMNAGQHFFPFSTPTHGPGHPFPSLPIYGHISQGTPMIIPQPPMAAIPAVQPMMTQVEVHGVGPSSKDPTHIKNPHAMTQMPDQSHIAHANLNRSTLVDRRDQLLEGGCTTGGVD
ncbi:hypothetical protein R6Q59_029585 [Mikania micrantha]